MKTKFFLFLCAGVIAASAEETVRKYDFNRNCEGWYTPSYWNGRLTHSAEAKSGGGSAKLEATEAKGHTFGRMVSQNLTKMPLAGKKFKISYQAKGSGTLFAGMLCATANSSGRLDYRYLFPETPLTLTKEWRKGEAVIDLQKTAPQTLPVSVSVLPSPRPVTVTLVTADTPSGNPRRRFRSAAPFPVLETEYALFDSGLL